MKNAIQKAIEGGYSIQKSYYTRHVDFLNVKSTNKNYTCFEIDAKTHIEDENGEFKEVNMTTTHHTGDILLDPLFWQCLGKSLGGEKYGTNNTIWQSVETWKYQWHRFIDHIADSGDVDEFFNNLIKQITCSK